MENYSKTVGMKTQYKEDISFFFKPIYRFNILIIKICTFDLWISTHFPKVYMERQNIQNSQYAIEGTRRNLESLYHPSPGLTVNQVSYKRVALMKE